MNEPIHTTPSNSRPSRLGERWLLPALGTGLLHGAALLMLWNSWSPQAPASAAQPVMVTQLITMPSPASEPPAPLPEQLPEPEPEPVVAEVPAPEPQIDHAEIARKRLEEQQQREREEQQRLADRRLEQEKERQKKEEQTRREQQERELAEQRALDEQQRLAAQAEANALAEAEAARRAAEAADIAQYQPISKKPPAYPRRALDRALEGDCTVSYTVTRSGRVSDPEVVEGACDDPMFARPSLAAAKSFRYQPRIINGQAVAVSDVRNTFRYRIE
ncbi:energy transducer TonB [Pseudomonas saliphila]|uniref:energy transducer TonB n=1 Tax=Pseudomonas saliphila TaxID=2586906 RepID=UPI00123C561D|nr:energy transducer TonB [Pseudomonas saliphila]